MTTETLEKAHALERKLGDMRDMVYTIEEIPGFAITLARRGCTGFALSISEATRKTIKTIVLMEIKNTIDELQAEFDRL